MTTTQITAAAASYNNSLDELLAFVRNLDKTDVDQVAARQQLMELGTKLERAKGLSRKAVAALAALMPVSNMGEVITKAYSPAAHMVTATAKSVSYIDLLAGAWKLNAALYLYSVGGDPLLSTISATLSLVDNALNYDDFYNDQPLPGSGINYYNISTEGVFTLAVPTRVYLVGYAEFAAQGVDFYGLIRAQRIPGETVQA